jgi:hypothetical protein
VTEAVAEQQKTPAMVIQAEQAAAAEIQELEQIPATEIQAEQNQR